MTPAVKALAEFPKLGSLFPMSFVLFASWFSGIPIAIAQYPVFLFLGLASFFGGVHVGIPFLLDLLGIPVDHFQLYLATTVVSSRFVVLLTTMNNFALTLLGACAMSGTLVVRWRQVLRSAGLAVVGTAITLGGLHTVFTWVLPNPYARDTVITDMQLLRVPSPETVFIDPPTQLPPLDPSLRSRLDRIGTSS